MEKYDWNVLYLKELSVAQTDKLGWNVNAGWILPSVLTSYACGVTYWYHSFLSQEQKSRCGCEWIMNTHWSSVIMKRSRMSCCMNLHIWYISSKR